MPQVHPIFNNFTTGEISPKMYGRIDLKKYHNGCIEMKNFISLPYGGATGRGGLHYVADAKYHDKESRTTGFDFSEAQTYALEFGHQYVRFFTDGGQIMVTSGGELVTNGTFDTDLSDWDDLSTGTGSIAWTAGKMRIAGGASGVGWAEQDIAVTDKKPYILSLVITENPITIRIGNTSGGEQIARDTEFPVGTATTIFAANGSTIYLQFKNSNDNNSDVDNVSLKLAVPYEIASPYDEGDLGQLIFKQAEDELWIMHPLYKPRRLTRTSDISWTLAEIDFIDGPYMDQETTPTITPSGTTGNITMTAGGDLWDPDHVGALWRLYDGTADVWGYVKITGWNSATSVDATVINDLASTTVDAWREGAWSDYNGWPRTMAFHEQRSVLGGSIEFPFTVWGSKITDDPAAKFIDFTPGIEALDNDPYTFSIPPHPNAIIKWMASGNVLLVGTLTGEATIRGAVDNPITPTAILIESEDTNGSMGIDALRIGKSVVFVQRMGLKLLDIAYNYGADSYQTTDLTLLSEHITGLGIEEIAYVKEPNSVIWGRREDGWLLSCTYNKIHDVVGWARHLTDGEVESITSVPGVYYEDELWAIVKRTIDGDTKRYVERMDSEIHVDSGLTYSSPIKTTELRGLDHLIGKEVEIVGDGAVHPSQVVPSSGDITLEYAVNEAYVGIGYTPTLTTNRPEVPISGTSMSLKKMWPEVWVRLLNTVGVHINGETVPFRTAGDAMDEGLPPFSGDKYINKLGWDEDGWITVEQRLPMPITVTCVFGTMTVGQ